MALKLIIGFLLLIFSVSGVHAQTATFTTTNTPTNSPTATYTNTPTNTVTNTITNTFTNTFTITRTFTPTWTPTLTKTYTPTATPTLTKVPTNTAIPTNTSIYTPTNTPTIAPYSGVALASLQATQIALAGGSEPPGTVTPTNGLYSNAFAASPTPGTNDNVWVQNPLPTPGTTPSTSGYAGSAGQLMEVFAIQTVVAAQSTQVAQANLQLTAIPMTPNATVVAGVVPQLTQIAQVYAQATVISAQATVVAAVATVQANPTPQFSISAFLKGSLPAFVATPQVQSYNYGSAASTVVAAGSPGQLEESLDLSGRHLFFPYAPIGSWKTASGAVSTATTVQVVAKSGVLNNTIVGFNLTSTSSSITNGSFTAYLVAGASTTIWSGVVQTGTGLFTPPNLSLPYVTEAGNNAVSLTTSAAVTSIQWQVSYTQDN